MTIMLNCAGEDNALWRDSLKRCLPDHEIHLWPDISDVSSVRYAVVSGHPHGDLLRYPNLRTVLSLSAGLDHLTRDPDFDTLRQRVAIVRMENHHLTRDMIHYVLYWLLHFQRGFGDYRKLQEQLEWQVRASLPLAQMPVAIVGIGQIGTALALGLHQQGFTVTGFTRRPEKADALKKTLPPQVRIFSGDEWEFFLQTGRIFVNVLPATAATDNIFNREAFAHMPQGAGFINIGRGNAVNVKDLIAALNSGQFAFAVLDVFAQEPLANDSALWRHPKVSITPHIAGQFHRDSMTQSVADNIIRIEKGQAPFPIFDTQAGY